MEFILEEYSHNLTITMSHVTLMLNKTIAIHAYTCVGTNAVSINTLKLIGAVSIKPIVVIQLKICGEGNKLANMVHVSNSNFTNIHFIGKHAIAFSIIVLSARVWSRFSVFSIATCIFLQN